MAEPETKDWPELPAPTFHALVDFFVNQAMMGLGGVPNPETGEPVVNLSYAKYCIDMLGVIEDKTKGSLTAPERNYLQNRVYDVRMTYLRLKDRPPQTDAPETSSEPESP